MRIWNGKITVINLQKVTGISPHPVQLVLKEQIENQLCGCNNTECFDDRKCRVNHCCVCPLTPNSDIFIFEWVDRTDWETPEVLGSRGLCVRRCRCTPTAALRLAGLCPSVRQQDWTQMFKYPSMLKKTVVIFVVKNCGRNKKKNTVKVKQNAVPGVNC